MAAKRNFKQEAAKLAASVLQSKIEVGALTNYAEQTGLDESELDQLTEAMYEPIEMLSKKGTRKNAKD